MRAPRTACSSWTCCATPAARELSGFAGGANKAMDADVWSIAPYTEADLQEQIDKADDFYGAEGAQLQQDLADYIAGINQFISEARTDATKMPYEYGAIGKPLEDWKGTDVIATASLVGGIFGKGGGNELGAAAALEEAKDRFGGAAGEQAWQDFRRRDDPEAPTTVKAGNGSFDYPRTRGTSGVALPDEGSLVNPPNNGSGVTLGGGLGGLLGGVGQLGGMSNALLVSGAESESGHPVAVMGPQVAYFMPQILVEMDLHGPDIDAQGAAFPGISPYVLLGRGQDYAWSATSAGQDIIDTFAEKLCEPDGSAPDVQSTHYLYKGECREMETLTRVNNITPNPGDPSPPETYTLQAQRTVHGIVAKRGTVDGEPVAFAKQRSTYFHEADSARAFADLNRPSKVQNAEDFQRVMHKINFTFNWFYADDRDIAYFNSGDNPERADGADPDLPNWGTGEYDWKGWETHFKTSDVTPFEEHPRVINQDYITSWNNKQAPGYDSADGQWGYGPHYRSDSLDDQIDQRLAGSSKMSLAEGIDSMELAGTTDLRGSQVLPLLLDVVGTPSDPQLASAVSTLQDWVAAGAHRVDRDQNGQYDHANADPDHGRVVAAPARGRVRARDGERLLRCGARCARLRQRAQQPRRPPRQRVPGRVVGLCLQGPAAPAGAARVRRLLAHLLRRRIADGVPRRAAPGARPTRSPCPRPRSTTRTRTRPASSASTPAPPARATSGASTPCASARSAPSRCAPSTGSTGRRSSRRSRCRVTGRAVTCAPKGATPLRVPLVPAYKACAAPNRQHGPPLAFASCNPPEQRSDYLTIGSPDANGTTANSIGLREPLCVPGQPLHPGGRGRREPAVQPHRRAQADATSRTTPASSQIDSVVRITDRDNEEAAGGGCDPATVNDFPLTIPVPCAATPDPGVGGTCAVATTLDAIVPSAIKEGDRSSWQMGAVQVFDGGADGLLSTTPNTLFAKQGIFIP